MNANRIDAMPAPGITVRFYPSHPDEVDVYSGGWRVGSYKTARGVQNAVARHSAPRLYWVQMGTLTFGAAYRADNVLADGPLSAEVASAFPTLRDLTNAARARGGVVIDVTNPGRPSTIVGAR